MPSDEQEGAPEDFPSEDPITVVETPKRMKTVRLQESFETICEALRNLLECPESRRPFVIIEDVATGRFVQFAGSKERGLLFDVPACGIVGEPCDTPERAAVMAQANLRLQRVADGALVRVVFESTRDGEPS